MQFITYIVAVKAINQEYIEEGILDRISQKYNIPEETVDEYYSVIFTILKIHLGTISQNIKPAEFKQILEELKYVFYDISHSNIFNFILISIILFLQIIFRMY